MITSLLLVLLAVQACSAYEIMPRATALRPEVEIRRAPVLSMSNFAPMARSLKPASTGIRRAPQVAEARPVVKKVVKMAPSHRSPMTVASMQQMPNLLNPFGLPQMIPVPVPVMVPSADVTFPTLAPHTLPTFTPLPGMPTMPALTMPPSFQRLLGLTTTTMKPASKEVEREEFVEDEYRPEKSSFKDLSSVRSRIPKFVSGEEVERKQSKLNPSADWMVPFV